MNPLHKVNQDFANSNKTEKKRVNKKLEEALNNNAPTTKSTSETALKVNEVQTHSMTAKESEVKTEMPTRPPPRAFMRDPLKRLRGESDPMPFDENTLSRVHAFPQESLKEEVQEESSPLVSETEIVVSAGGCDSIENDDDSDDFDTDEWDSDFDVDDDDDEDHEQQKRDSQSSRGSSCDAEPLVSNYNNFRFTLNFLINSY